MQQPPRPPVGQRVLLSACSPGHPRCGMAWFLPLPRFLDLLPFQYLPPQLLHATRTPAGGRCIPGALFAVYILRVHLHSPRATHHQNPGLGRPAAHVAGVRTPGGGLLAPAQLHGQGGWCPCSHPAGRGTFMLHIVNVTTWWTPNKLMFLQSTLLVLHCKARPRPPPHRGGVTSAATPGTGW